MKQERARKALEAYFSSPATLCTPYGNGHINDTYYVEHETGAYILQRMNTHVFPCPEQLMENIVRVTAHIGGKAEAQGLDPHRATLTVIPTILGADYHVDDEGDYYRLYLFVTESISYERVENDQTFYLCAKAFGEFQGYLADFPAEELHHVIANFHNTPWRYEMLMEAVAKNPCGRLCEVETEVDFARMREAFCHTLENAYKAGILPKRVTHNDTKLNNILFDGTTGAPVCVIDLDTIMPGYSVTDFGDAIRFGANTAKEDETDLSKVSLDLHLFEVFAKGFIEGCNGNLKTEEIALLPEGAMMMTLECGMRFLTDYLNGDVYFKVHRTRHNLDRARNQFALVADMEKKLPEMQKIIEKLRQ